MRGAEQKDRMAQPPQSRRRELEPDHEQQQRDPQLGNPDLPLGIADQTEHMRPHHGPGDEVAQGRAQSEPPEQQHERQRRAEQNETVPEEVGGGGGVRHHVFTARRILMLRRVFL